MISYCIRQTKHTSNYLLHIHTRRPIRKRSKNIRKWTIPSLFQRIHCNNITHWAIGGHQIYSFQFIYIRRLYFNLFFRNIKCQQSLFYFLKSFPLFHTLLLRLCLKQHYWTNIVSFHSLLSF